LSSCGASNRAASTTVSNRADRLAYGSASASVKKTEIVYWSPLDSTGAVKRSLSVRFMRGGQCSDIGYTYVGGIAYRCTSRNYLLNACWREGPTPTEFVICAVTPWDKQVERLRSRHLLLYPGVTWEPASTSPWAIELANGTRCSIFQGAHDAMVYDGRRYWIDYSCTHNVVLMHEGLRRGRIWQAIAARVENPTGRWRYKFLGYRTIRRVYFGKLPPPLARQNRFAGEAVRAARSIVLGQTPKAHLDLTWVRMALPQADWAYVIFRSAGDRGWFALVHRDKKVWLDASAHEPYCSKLPRRARKQLFLGKRTWNPVPDRFMAPRAPRGEQRC
jgi:hypothetical protein